MIRDIRINGEFNNASVLHSYESQECPSTPSEERAVFKEPQGPHTLEQIMDDTERAMAEASLHSTATTAAPKSKSKRLIWIVLEFDLVWRWYRTDATALWRTGRYSSMKARCSVHQRHPSRNVSADA